MAVPLPVPLPQRYERQTMTTTGIQDLEAALASLGPRRHQASVLAAEYRDRFTAEGDHRMAAVCNALAVVVAEIEDKERDLLAALADRPGVAKIEPEHGVNP